MPLDPGRPRQDLGQMRPRIFNQMGRQVIHYEPYFHMGGPGRGERFFEGLVGRSTPREVYPGTGVPDPRSPEGFGSLLSMLFGRKPQFAISHQRAPKGRALSVAGFPEEAGLHLGELLTARDIANAPLGQANPLRPTTAGTLDYRPYQPGDVFNETGLPAHAGTIYVPPPYRRTDVAQRLMREFLERNRNTPFETFFVNKDLQKVALKKMEREGWRAQVQQIEGGPYSGYSGSTLFLPPNYRGEGIPASQGLFWQLAEDWRRRP